MIDSKAPLSNGRAFPWGGRPSRFIGFIWYKEKREGGSFYFMPLL